MTEKTSTANNLPDGQRKVVRPVTGGTMSTDICIDSLKAFVKSFSGKDLTDAEALAIVAAVHDDATAIHTLIDAHAEVPDGWTPPPPPMSFSEILRDAVNAICGACAIILAEAPAGSAVAGAASWVQGKMGAMGVAVPASLAAGILILGDMLLSVIHGLAPSASWIVKVAAALEKAIGWLRQFAPAGGLLFENT